MDFLKKILRSKKCLNNVLTAFFIGILLIIVGSSFLKTDKTGLVNKSGDSGENNPEEEVFIEKSYEKELEDELEQTLSLVEGVGEVKVMITLKEGSENVYKNDTKNERQTGEGSEKNIEEEKTVFSNSGEPLKLKEAAPKIEGVVVVAQGGDDPMVKKSLISGIQALLGVEAHKIEILKMK